MKKITTSILLMFIAAVAVAGPKLKNVKGTVTDGGQELLAGAKIEIKGTDIVVYSDFEGNFTIDQLEPGTYDVTISLISYKELEVKKVRLTADNASDLSFQLTSR